MGYEYTSEARRADKYSLPNVEVFQMTAREIAEQDEEMIWEYMRKPEYRLASMNSRTRDAMLDAMVEEEQIKGGWMWWTCFPGCMPDSCPNGPFDSYADALADAREQYEEEEEGEEI